MNKWSKPPSLTNLLSTHRYLSRRSIHDILGVSSKTTLRYLSALASSGAPLTYNHISKGYRLINHASVTQSTLDTREEALISMNQQLPSQKLNHGYRKAICSLLEKLKLPLQFANVGRCGPPATPCATRESDLVPVVLNMRVIFAAASGRLRLRLEVKCIDGRARVDTLREPFLEFKDEWRIIDRTNPQSPPIRLSDVRTATAF